MVPNDHHIATIENPVTDDERTAVSTYPYSFCLTGAEEGDEDDASHTNVNNFLLDSGSTEHIIIDKELVKDFVNIEAIKILTGRILPSIR